MAQPIELQGGSLEPKAQTTPVVPTELEFVDRVEVLATDLVGNAADVTPTDILFKGSVEFSATDTEALPVGATDLLFFGGFELPAKVYVFSPEEMAEIVAAVWADPIAVAANAKLDSVLEGWPC